MVLKVPFYRNSRAVLEDCFSQNKHHEYLIALNMVMKRSASFPEGLQSNDKTFIMVAMGIEFASSMQQNTAYVVKDKGTMAFIGCF